MAPKTEIHIKGQKELEAAFLSLRRDVFLEMKAELVKAGDAVKAESTRRLPTEASNVMGRWGQFRIGATVKGVYVAPKSRNRGGSKRPNLAAKILSSMEGALEAKRAETEAEFNAMVDAAAAKNGFF